MISLCPISSQTWDKEKTPRKISFKFVTQLFLRLQSPQYLLVRDADQGLIVQVFTQHQIWASGR